MGEMKLNLVQVRPHVGEVVPSVCQVWQCLGWVLGHGRFHLGQVITHPGHVTPFTHCELFPFTTLCSEFSCQTDPALFPKQSAKIPCKNCTVPVSYWSKFTVLVIV